GEVFDGVITAVTSFGLFVELKGVFVEGLLHITALDKDYYHFDPVGHRLVGERTGQVYRLGDAVTVQVARVDLDERKIDFVLPRGEVKPAAAAAEEGEETPARKKRHRRKKPGKGGAEEPSVPSFEALGDERSDDHEPGDVNGNVLIDEGGTGAERKPKKRRRRPPRRAKPE
ncbi:MAG: S1 RNA-binding domain-containing protein, partial [Halothiobacillaceae bacterium]